MKEKENWKITEFIDYTRKICYINNQIHKLDGPAVIDYVINNGNEIILRKMWYKNNKKHREGNKPSLISYYDDGQLKEVRYHVDDLLHRENGAAVVGFFHNGKVQYMEYLKNGQLSNIEKPSILEFDQNGNLRYYAYYLNNKYHRENGPALEIFNSYGCIYSTEYYNNGNLHRVDGPALINHARAISTHFINGNYIKKNEYNELIKKIQDKSILKSVNRYKEKKFNVVYQLVKHYGDKEVIEAFDNRQMINNLSL